MITNFISAALLAAHLGQGALHEMESREPVRTLYASAKPNTLLRLGGELSPFQHPKIFISQDGTMLVAGLGGGVGAIAAWDTGTWQRREIADIHMRDAAFVAVSPDVSEVVTADADSTTVHVWDVTTGMKVKTLMISLGGGARPQKTFTAAAWSHDGEVFRQNDGAMGH